MTDLRTCSTCRFWDIEGHTSTTKDGYREAVCLEPKDERDRKSERGGHYCSKWGKPNE